MRSVKFILLVSIIFAGSTGCRALTEFIKSRGSQYAGSVGEVGEPEKSAIAPKMESEQEAKSAMDAIKGLLESAGSARKAIYTAYSRNVPYEQVKPACDLYEKGISSIYSILALLDKKNYSQVQKEVMLATTKLSKAEGIAQTLESLPVIAIRENVNQAKDTARKTQDVVLRTYKGNDRELFYRIFYADFKILAALAALNEKDYNAVQYNLQEAENFYARARDLTKQVKKSLAMKQTRPPQLLPIQHIDHTGTESEHKMPHPKSSAKSIHTATESEHKMHHPKSTPKSTMPQIIVDDSGMQGMHHDHSQMQHTVMMKTPAAGGSSGKMSKKIDGLTFHLKIEPERVVSGKEAEYRVKIEGAGKFSNLQAKFDMPMMRGMHVFNPIPKYDNAVGDYSIKQKLPMAGVWELEFSVLTNQSEKKVAFEITVF